MSALSLFAYGGVAQAQPPADPPVPPEFAPPAEPEDVALLDWPKVTEHVARAAAEHNLEVMRLGAYCYGAGACPDALVVADLITDVLIDDQAGVGNDDLSRPMAAAASARAIVHQATGMIAAQHVAALRAGDRARLVGLVDTDPGRAAAVASGRSPVRSAPSHWLRSTYWCTGR